MLWAVGIEDVGAVVIRVVALAQSRRAVVDRACLERRGVERVDRLAPVGASAPLRTSAVIVSQPVASRSSPPPLGGATVHSLVRASAASESAMRRRAILQRDGRLPPKMGEPVPVALSKSLGVRR